MGLRHTYVIDLTSNGGGPDLCSVLRDYSSKSKLEQFFKQSVLTANAAEARFFYTLDAAWLRLSVAPSHRSLKGFPVDMRQ